MANASAASDQNTPQAAIADESSTDSLSALVASASFPPTRPQEYVPRYWKQGTRPDGRLMSQTRPTQVTTPKSNQALVTLGETRILSTVTVQVGSATTTPAGDVVVLLEFPCDLAQPSQSPAATAAPIQAYTQRIIMETLPLDQLSLQQHCPSHTESSSVKLSHWAFRLNINLQVLVQDGNLWDAALLASLAALQNTRLPQLQWNEITKQFVQLSSRQHAPTSLIVPTVPVSLTLGLYKHSLNDKAATGKNSKANSQIKYAWITDPSLLEESCLTSCLTVVVNAAASGNGELLSVEYSGHESVQPTDELLLAIRMAQARAQEVQDDLLKAVGS